MSTLATLRNDVRRDLRDTEVGGYKWSDEELDRHITRAVADYTEVAPAIGSVSQVAGESASYDLSATDGWLWCERVEYPADRSPRSTLAFEETTRGMVHLIDRLPTGPGLPTPGEEVRFWYARQHTVDATICTVPYQHESLVTLGAIAYALLAYADYAIGRVNPASCDPRNYRELGLVRLEQFRAELARLRAERGWTVGMVSWG